jgi:hypothetical protein
MGAIDLSKVSGRKRLAWEWVELKQNGPLPTKPDMDLIRTLLLEIESGQTRFKTYPLDPTVQKIL